MDKDQKVEPKDQKSTDESSSLKIKIGEEEKTLTAADVQELLAKHSGLQKKVEGLASFEKILDRYGVDTDTYIKHSEGAIAIASKLIEEGVIDAQGKLVQRKEPPKDEPKFFEKAPSGDRTDEITAKALGPLAEKMKKIEETQARLVESDMRSRLGRKHPDLSEEDMDVVFDTAFRDRSKTLSQHAEAYALSKGQKRGELRKEFAKEFGIDLDEHEKKKSEESLKKEKGMSDLSFLVADRELAFETGGDKKKVSPRQATIEFFKRHGIGR